MVANGKKLSLAKGVQEGTVLKGRGRMKKGTSVFVLVFLFVLGMCPYVSAKRPGDLVPISDVRKIENNLVIQNLQSSTLRAQQIFAKSVQTISEKAARTLAQIASLRLGSSMMRWPKTGTNFRHCDESKVPVAFTLPRDFDFRNIFLCHKTLFEYFQERILSQILIHEAIHLAGVVDECEASVLEKKVMYAGSGGLSYYTSHMRRCGIEP